MKASIGRRPHPCEIGDAATTRETAADDGPDADTSTPPIPPESAARKRSADASCISRAHPLQSGQSIRPAVASPPRSPVHLPPPRYCRLSNCGASASHSRSTTSSPTALAVVPSRFLADISPPPPSLSLRNNAPAPALDSSCPTAARYPAAASRSAPSLPPRLPLQRDFSCEKTSPRKVLTTKRL